LIACRPLDNDAVLDRFREIAGTEDVLSRDEELLVYECDAYTLQKFHPGVVLLPRTTDEVVRLVKLCHELGLPIVPHGAGTKLSGASIPLDDAAPVGRFREDRRLRSDSDSGRIPTADKAIHRTVRFGDRPKWRRLRTDWIYTASSRNRQQQHHPFQQPEADTEQTIVEAFSQLLVRRVPRFL
jgi:hypothetical protein